MEIEEVKLDKFGQLPMKIEMWLFDNAPQEIEVPTWWVRQMLLRLTSLKKLDKGEIAKADIPTGIECLLKVIPPKILKKLI